MRLAGEFKLQEDGHASYDGAGAIAGLQPWEFHRNRIGVKGKYGKRVDFEVEYELTEKELTDKEALIPALEKRLLQSKLKPRQETALRDFLESKPELDNGIILNAIRLVMSTPEYQLT